MEEIIKHINDTNASFRTPNAGDAKNTDLFLDNEHYDLFKDEGEQITVRYNKENLSKAILFIASILPRKYDNSGMHKSITYSSEFVYDQLAFLDYFFKESGVSVDKKTQKWNVRKDVPKKNGEIDNRFYFNGLFEEVTYVNSKGEHISSKFTIRNYLAGGYSNLHIKKAEDGIFDVWVTNVKEAYFDDEEDGLEELDRNTLTPFPLQTIFYGAPGTGKSHKVKEVTDTLPKSDVFRTTFHPDSDYSTFVGCYKPKMVKAPIRDSSGHEITSACEDEKKRIAYEYEPQAFLKAYVRAYETADPVFLVIEEINRGNCAQIFGDMFQLLDRNENGESDYAIKPETAIQEFLNEKLEKCDIADEAVKSGEEMRLPANLHIWATMNTSDQSLFPIDSAFKRRWDWKYMPIKRADKEPENKWIIKVTHDDKTYWCYWWEFLEAINHQIEETTHSEDKQLGYFFAKPKAGEDFISTDTFVNKVIFYLWNDVFKDEDSAVFQYDNNKVEDVSVNRSGTMYFRHFMANTDEMIHYFINQLFAMGKDNNPVVPIDYLKNDKAHLSKMREGEPLKLDDGAGDEETFEDNGINVRKSDSIDNIDFSTPAYKKMSEKLTQALNGNEFKYSKNSMDMKMGDMPISYARLSMAYSSKKTDIKLYIPAKSGYNKSIECYNYLNSKRVEDIIAKVSKSNNLEYELISENIVENKVLGWRIMCPMTLSDLDDNTMDGYVASIVEIVKELQEKITPIMDEFSKNGK